MMKNMHYIKSSIYYQPEGFPKLFTEGLKTFKNKLGSTGYMLSLNKDQGHNVRMVIPTSEKEFDAVVMEFHRHVQDFMKANPSPANSQPNRQALFMDFPVNTLQYDMFEHIPFIIRQRNWELNIDEFLADFWNLVIEAEVDKVKTILSNRVESTLEIFLVSLYSFSTSIQHAERVINQLLAHAGANNFPQEPGMEENIYMQTHTVINHSIKERWQALSSKNVNDDFLSALKNLFQNLNAKVKTLSSEDQQSLILYQLIKRLSADLDVKDHKVFTYLLLKCKEVLAPKNELVSS